MTMFPTTTRCCLRLQAAMGAVTLLVCIRPALADDRDDKAAALVRSTVERAFEVLRDPKQQGPEMRRSRHGRLREISDEVFDWSTMAKRSLGVHWRNLNEQQRNRFSNVFKELLATNYLTQIDRFDGTEKLSYEGVDRTEATAEVKMLLTTKSRETYPIHFFVNEDLRVFDVSIEGVSISNHYRGTFDRLLVNSSFDSLVKKLESKVRSKSKRLYDDGTKDVPKSPSQKS
jgi:phospholipid transport system substrate-binding protein